MFPWWTSTWISGPSLKCRIISGYTIVFCSGDSFMEPDRGQKCSHGGLYMDIRSIPQMPDNTRLWYCFFVQVIVLWNRIEDKNVPMADRWYRKIYSFCKGKVYRIFIFSFFIYYLHSYYPADEEIVWLFVSKTKFSSGSVEDSQRECKKNNIC